MIIETWGDVLSQSFLDLWTGIVSFLPNVVVAIIIFLAGWVVGALVGRIVAQIITALKVDHLLRTTGIESVVNRAGFRMNAGVFVGELVQWFVILVFLVAAFDVLGLSQVNIFLQQVVLLYLPQVIVAVLILLAAGVVADAMQSVVSGAARAAGVPSANFLGTVTRWSIWIFAVLAALYQLGVAAPFVQTLFTGIVVAVSLALGLSFGLGGQHAASRFLDRMQSDIKS